MAVTLNDTLGVKREFKSPHYDFGMPFWEATRQKKLVIQYCKTAKKFQHFPRPVSIRWVPSTRAATAGRLIVTFASIAPRAFVA